MSHTIPIPTTGSWIISIVVDTTLAHARPSLRIWRTIIIGFSRKYLCVVGAELGNINGTMDITGFRTVLTGRTWAVRFAILRVVIKWA